MRRYTNLRLPLPNLTLSHIQIPFQLHPTNFRTMLPIDNLLVKHSGNPPRTNICYQQCSLKIVLTEQTLSTVSAVSCTLT